MTRESAPVIRKFFRWLRGLLPLPRTRQAAQPGTRKRVMHLMAPGMRAACGPPASPENWVTVQLPFVNCKDCRRIGARQKVRHTTRLR